MTKDELKRNLGLVTEEDIICEFVGVVKDIERLVKAMNENDEAGADPEIAEVLEDKAYILVTQMSELAELLPERLEELKELARLYVSSCYVEEGEQLKYS